MISELSIASLLVVVYLLSGLVYTSLQEDYGNSIKKIFSAWITVFLWPAAWVRKHLNSR